MFGSTGRLLNVDLSTQTTTVTSIDSALLEQFVGGSALAARLFFDAGGMNADPLSPENPLIVMAGPLTGTTFPGTSRFVMCARSPLTGIWGEAATGGFFGAELKKANLDGLLITGRAVRPMVINIQLNQISLDPVPELWGQDTFDTIDALQKKYPGKRRLKSLVIGPAGENLVKYAAVCNDKAHYIGRTGMGAVMGSKLLKAIVARGSETVAISDKEAFGAARDNALANIKDSMISNSMHALGTAAAMDMGMMTGDVPIKNWSVGLDYALADAIGGPAISEHLLDQRKACYACPIACKPVVSVKTDAFELKKVPGPEYETCASFGSMLMNDDLKAIAFVNDRCNRLGLDTISCGATIAFIMEMFAQGDLTPEETDGLDLTWGNIDAATKLVDKIAYRDGFGDRAAEGSLRLAREIGPQAVASTVTVKGLELPMHDPRAYHGQGLAYMTSNRGACHLQHSVQAIEQGMVAWPDVGFEEDYDATQSAGKANMVCRAEDVGQMANAICLCHFVHWAMGMNPLIDGLTAVTGRAFDYEGFLESGRRAWYLKRALNNLMGVTGIDDRLPKRILTALDDGGAAGSVPDAELMKREYYQARGLDEKGVPRVEILEKLGLGILKDRLKEI